MTRELLQQALSELEMECPRSAVISALRAALAQPAPEPVAWMSPGGICVSQSAIDEMDDAERVMYPTPLYASPAAPAPEEMSPEFTDTARNALLWVLWHHQGASSKVGAAMRFALGMGAQDRMTAEQVARAKVWDEPIPGLAHMAAAPAPVVPAVQPLTYEITLPPLPQPTPLKLKTALSDDDIQTLTYWVHETALAHKRQMDAYADAVQLSVHRNPLDAIQISNIAKANDIHHFDHPARMKFALQFARAIEQAHGITGGGK